MISRKILTLLIVSFIFYRAHAGENNLVYLGGGGEDQSSPTTQFDNEATLFGEYYQRVKNNYKTTVAFNGGHTETEKIIRNGMNGATIKNSFNQTNTNAIIEDLLKKMENNTIAANDKIMIFIDTHGAEKQIAQSTHNVSYGNTQLADMNAGSTSTEEAMNLDTLKKLTEMAKLKKIKLAIIDGSCHSGNSLGLANENTCVISGSSPNQYASDLTDMLMPEMKPGVNLEDAFLKARARAQGTPFPMISSPAGLKVQADMEKMLPYLLYHNDSEGQLLNKIDSYVGRNSNDNVLCKRQADFIELNKLLNQIEKISNSEAFKKLNMPGVNLKGLRQKIADYKKVQDDYMKRIKETEFSDKDLDKTNVFSSKRANPVPYTNRELLETDFDQMIKNVQADLKKTKNKLSVLKYQAMLDIYRLGSSAKNKLLNDPKYKKYQKIMDELKVDQAVSESVAENIGKDMREAYDVYYRGISPGFKGKANPCADFVI